MIALVSRTAGRTAGLPDGFEERPLRQRLIELPQIIENDLWLSHSGQPAGDLFRSEVAERPVPEALVWNPPELLLDGFDRFAGLAPSLKPQPYWEDRRKPANGSGDVEILEDLFPAVSFEVDQHCVSFGPLRESQRQRRQQQIVDLRMVDLGRLLQQGGRLLTGQSAVHRANRGRRVGALVVIDGQRLEFTRADRLP